MAKRTGRTIAPTKVPSLWIEELSPAERADTLLILLNRLPIDRAMQERVVSCRRLKHFHLRFLVPGLSELELRQFLRPFEYQIYKAVKATHRGKDKETRKRSAKIVALRDRNKRKWSWSKLAGKFEMELDTVRKAYRREKELQFWESLSYPKPDN